MLPNYLKSGDFLVSSWPLFAVAVGLAVLVGGFISWKAENSGRFVETLIVLLAFSVLGIVAGNLTGLSRDPAVGTVVPAILTLVGSVLAYLLGTKNAGKQMLVSGGIICLATTLLVGTYWGARARILFEADLKAYSGSAASVAIEAEDNSYRVALQRISHEIQFAQLKAALEKQHNTKFLTNYPELQGATTVKP